MRFNFIHVWLVLFVFLTAGASHVHADLIPPGHKAVSHKLVFVDSPLLESHRLIAMPVRGLGGHEEVQPNRPFHFSTKYGTRLYVVPNGFVPPARAMPGKPLPFPSCDVPISSRTYVPIISPVTSMRSTCELVSVDENSIRVELVDHVELDSDGQPASHLKSALPMLAISATGLIGCCLVWRRTRASRQSQLV